MDFLNKTFAQITDLFRSMTPSARITAGLLMVIVIVSITYLLNHQISGSDTYLMGGRMIEPDLLPAMEAAFGKANLSDYEVVGNRIRVPHGKQAKYMVALAEGGALPPRLFQEMEEAVKGSGPFENRKQQAKRLKIAKNKELSRWISAMPGIRRAAIFTDVTKSHGFRSTETMTASVTVKTLPGQKLDENKVRAIRHLVASAFAGLKASQITVVDTESGEVRPGRNDDSDFSSPLDNPYAELKRQYEKQWEEKIYKAINIPGITVVVNVELDTEISRQENILKYDPKPVNVRSESTETSKNVFQDSPRGRPGPAANSAMTPMKISSAGQSTKIEDTLTKTRTDGVTGRTSTQSKKIGLTPKRVTVSIGIPVSYYEKVWKEKNPTTAGEEPKKPDDNLLTQIKGRIIGEIEKQVVALLPEPPAGVDRFPRVVVTTFQDFTPEEIPEPEMSQRALAWLGQYWSTLGMTGLALFSLVMLRSMIRSVSAPKPGQPAKAVVTSTGAETSAPATIPMVPPDEEKPTQEQTPQQRLRRRGITGPSLRDELSEIVREDPDSAANILRSWIGNAS